MLLPDKDHCYAYKKRSFAIGNDTAPEHCYESLTLLFDKKSANLNISALQRYRTLDAMATDIKISSSITDGEFLIYFSLPPTGFISKEISGSGIYEHSLKSQYATIVISPNERKIARLETLTEEEQDQLFDLLRKG